MGNFQQVGCQSDIEWQEQFNKMRNSTLSIHERPDNFYHAFPEYAAFLSGILYTIRHGEIDYCYSPEHIADLLRFEKQSLRSRWLPKEKYFRVWLEF